MATTLLRSERVFGSIRSAHGFFEEITAMEKRLFLRVVGDCGVYYDITSTYFEGQADSNGKAARGIRATRARTVNRSVSALW